MFINSPAKVLCNLKFQINAVMERNFLNMKLPVLAFLSGTAFASL